MYHALVKCPKCDFIGIRNIHENLNGDKTWICPTCEKRYTNVGIIK